MPSQRPPWWMFIIAASFLTLFSFIPYLWLFGPDDPAGLAVRFIDGKTEVLTAEPGSQVERAGLRAGDLILAVDNHPARNTHDWNEIKANMEVGKAQSWEISRSGQRVNLQVIPVLVARGSDLFIGTLFYNICIALCYIIVGFFIAFRRPFDPVARMGAWFIVTASIAFGVSNGWAVTWRSLPSLLQYLLWIPQASRFVIEGIFLSFVVLFPRRIFHGRWPWVLIWVPVLATLPWRIYGMHAVIYRPGQGSSTPTWLFQVSDPRTVIYLIVGIVLLAVNYRRLVDLNERRRLRILVAGTAISLISGIGILWLTRTRGFYLGPIYPLIWFFLPLTLACPLAFSYAILRHRALDVQLIVRHGLQYALARRAVLGVIPTLVLLLVADLAINSQQPLAQILRSRGWVYAGMGGIAVLVHSRRKQWLEALDRHFFRERYDARQVLREVVGEIRQARDLDRVAPLVVARIEAALHPEFAALLVREPRENVYHSLALTPAGQALPPLDAESKLMGLLRVLGKPLEVLTTTSQWLERGLPHEDTDFLRRAKIDLLVPIATTTGRREAILALGVKRSEEPYTQEDQELLEAIAASLALLVEQAAPEPQRSVSAMEECPQCGVCYDSGTGNCVREGAGLIAIGLPRFLASRYQMERRLGRGGMGTVYAAIDLSLQRAVAVKVMREELAGNSVAVERFHREARAAASFAHPHVVTVHDFGVESGTRAYLVMELLEGSPLREELKRLKQIEPSRTLHIMEEVCSAVEAAHRRQMIHRDLKPENIFLVRNPVAGSPLETVKVLDFGVAKSISLPQEAPGTKATTIDTGPGIMVGTAAYMSPEQLTGEAATVGWDLWALSIVTYEMLTGALPFVHKPGPDWARAVLSGTFTPITRHLPQAPLRWHEFFTGAFSVSRAARPSSVREFLDRLEQALLELNHPITAPEWKG